MAISQADGNAINAAFIDGQMTLTWGAGTVQTPIATGGLISGFSCFGRAADLSLKPDLGAPGSSAAGLLRVAVS